jgi:hypothetical protein
MTNLDAESTRHPAQWKRPALDTTAFATLLGAALTMVVLLFGQIVDLSPGAEPPAHSPVLAQSASQTPPR